jgi:hypothetical protein
LSSISPDTAKSVQAALDVAKGYANELRRLICEASDSGSAAGLAFEALMFDDRTVLDESNLSKWFPRHQRRRYLKQQLVSIDASVGAAAALARDIGDAGVMQPIRRFFDSHQEPHFLGIAAIKGPNGGPIRLRQNPSAAVRPGDLVFLVDPHRFESRWLLLESQGNPGVFHVLASAGSHLDASWYAYLCRGEGARVVRAELAAYPGWKNLLRDGGFSTESEWPVRQIEKSFGAAPGEPANWTLKLTEDWFIGGRWEHRGHCRLEVNRGNMAAADPVLSSSIPHFLEIDVHQSAGLSSLYLLQAVEPLSPLAGLDAVASAYVQRIAGAAGRFAIHFQQFGDGALVAPGEAQEDGLGPGFSRLEIYQALAPPPDDVAGHLRIYLSLPFEGPSKFRVGGFQFEIGMIASEFVAGANPFHEGFNG